MSEILDYEEAIRPFLSEKRYHHSLCVAEAAEELARQYGADEEKAWSCRDFARYSQRDAGRGAAEDARRFRHCPDGFGAVPRQSSGTPSPGQHTWSIPCISRTGKSSTRCAITPRCRADMTLLEKILFVADYTSADRQFDGVDRLRSPGKGRVGSGRPFGLRFLRLRIWPICIRRSIPIRWRHTTGMSLQGEDTRKENQGYGSLGPAEREKTGTPEK